MRHWLLALYPRGWRDRYGEEMLQLLEETGVTPTIAADVLRSAMRERARELAMHMTEDVPMRLGVAHRHPTAFALAALLVIAPTALLILASLIGHELGIVAVARAIDPLIVAVTAWWPIDLFLVGAPALALLLAVLPMVEVGLQRQADGSLATLGVRLRWWNVTIALVALALGVLLVGHHVIESALEAGR